MRYDVYSEHMITGQTNYMRTFNTPQDAIHHIAKCYKIDTELCQLGEYYYFMKIHLT